MSCSVHIFDFDGTLTTHDTLLAFIAHACGRGSLVAGLLRFSPQLVLMKLGLYANYRVKQKFIAHYFKGMPIDRFDSLCRDFAATHRHLLRPEGIATLGRAISEGSQVLVVSASIDNWVAPFFDAWQHEQAGNEPRLQILGTQLEVVDGRLTGHFLTPNCYGPEKVRRIRAVLTAPRETYDIDAYGDSRGDKEMLAYANRPHYKPFRH
jgi:HAD superfamily hydrolase (TIGR01490 family)